MNKIVAKLVQQIINLDMNKIVAKMLCCELVTVSFAGTQSLSVCTLMQLQVTLMQVKVTLMHSSLTPAGHLPLDPLTNTCM